MIQQYLEPIITYLKMNPQMGILFAFVVAFSESLPVFGTIIPGSITMTGIGTLVGSGILPGMETLFWASIGAFFGDNIGFYAGYYFNKQIPRMWPFNKYPHWLKIGERFFEKHGGKSIIFGRFVGPARSTIPLIAGLLRFTQWRFQVAAFPSAFLWAIMYLVPGILLGALAVELPPQKTTEFVLIGLGIIVALWFIYWVIQRFFKELSRFINKYIKQLWAWLNHHSSTRPLIRYIHNKQHSHDHHQLTLSLLSLLSFILFSILFIGIATHSFMSSANLPMFQLFQSLRNYNLDKVFVVFALIGAPKTIVASTILISLGLAIRKQWRPSTHLIMCIAIAAAYVLAARFIFHSPRPEGFVSVKSSSSFPSGHVVMSIAFFGFIAHLCTRILDEDWHWIPYLLAGILITLIALSRLYLGAHWLTDVLGGTFAGFSTLLITIMHFRRYPSERSDFSLDWKSWSIIVSIGIFIPWIVFTSLDFKKTLEYSTPMTPIKHTTVDAWWKSPLQQLPIYRNNRFGQPIQPLNVQWSGNLDWIKQTLLNHGWEVLNKNKDIKTTLKRFATHDPRYHMPIFPWLFLHRKPLLTMIYRNPDDKSILELRLWDSYTMFTDNDMPLWIGMLDLHVSTEKMLTLKYNKEFTFNNDTLIKKLIPDLNKYVYKLIVANGSQPKKIKELHWNGEIIIIKPNQSPAQ